MTPSFFISSFYLFHCHIFLSSNIENFESDLPQLERPKVAKAHNITWHPKVAKTNNDMWCLKVTKLNNATTCFLQISFLFNFLVVNLTKHNDQQVFHSYFTSTLKIGKS
jgi:hypothetical protein